MTTIEFKENIKQYNDISRGIKDLKNRIRKIEEQSRIVKDSVRGSSKSFPYTQHTCIVEGLEQNEKLKKRKRLLRTKQKELECIKEQVEIYINTQIKDERIRQILEYKYIDGLSYIKIVHKLGGGTEDSIRMEIKRFFQKI